jgi:uncharacterized protein (DUF1800 family)
MKAVSLAPLDQTEAVAPAPRRGMTRRQVLAAAAATGIGVGVIRLLGGSIQQIASPQRASGSDWASPLNAEGARVMQLLRRATFGYTPAQLESALSDGFDKTVDRLLETKPAEPAVPSFANTPGGRFPINQLQSWWVDHILSTPTPFAERMTLFWHGHFTSDYRKVANDTYIYWQNLTWRRMGLTNLPSMLMQVTTDPAMLRYLDLATSTGQSPNENYSRELMELFTMGAGNYTEEDVRESAKALAGWVEPTPDSIATVSVASGVTQRQPVYATQKIGVFNPRRAYRGSVSYLGKTGPLDTQGVLDRILAQPATAVFITNKLVTHFVTARPAQTYVNGLAATFRRSKYDIKTLMRALFTSPEFSAGASYRSLIKSPAEFMIHAARALGVTTPNMSKLIAASGSGMGQSLFDPPDVNGWPNNESWISSNTVVERVNFVSAALAQAKGALPKPADAVHAHLDGVLSKQTETFLSQAADDRARWFITLASPEFQLK